MKQFYRAWMAFHVWIYRRTGGRLGGSMMGNKVLLLHTTGRKSGKAYTTPLGYFPQEGGYLLAASNGGSPVNPAWYLNLMSKPQTTVQIGSKVISVTAEALAGEAREQGWQRVITAAPSYANYQKRTTRQIPVVLLRPTE